MFEYFKIKRKIRKLRKIPINEGFLKLFKLRLMKYIQENPVRIEPKERLLYTERSSFINLITTKFKAMPIPIIAALIIILSGGGTVLASQASLPGEMLYPVKILSEETKSALTINPESKAKYRLELAAKRVEEIKDLLEEKGVEPEGLDIALEQIEKNIAKAADIIEKEKGKGKDVSSIAGELVKNFESSKSIFKQTLKNEKRALEIKKEEIKNQLAAARQANDAAQIALLKQELEKVEAQKDLLEVKGEEADEAMEEREERIEEEMEVQYKAEKAIREAEEEKGEIIDEAAEEGVELPVNAFAEFDSLLAEAKNALAAGNFVEAKNLAKRAEKSLDKLEKAIEEMEKKQEKREEAEEAIQEAEEEKQEVLNEASKEGIELPPATFTKFDRLLTQAKELFAKENYQGAKQLAEQAKDTLEDVDKEIEKLEKEKEQKEEQMKEEEERKQEQEEKQQEGTKDQNNEKEER